MPWNVYGLCEKSKAQISCVYCHLCKKGNFYTNSRTCEELCTEFSPYIGFLGETDRTRIWRPRAGKIVCDYMYHVDFYHVNLFFTQQNFKN